MSHSFARLHVHLVFATKQRVPMLDDTIRAALHGYMAGILRNLDSEPVLINSVEDHVHILFELGRTIALSKAVEEVKRSSSRWIKTQGTQFATFSWQTGYAAFAVSQRDVTGVRNYIAKQREHHSIQKFQTEYRSLLDDNGIAFDEHDVWD
jgi:REP element-mobilizing transposase RayT